MKKFSTEIRRGLSSQATSIVDGIEELYTQLNDANQGKVKVALSDFSPEVNPYKTIGDFFDFIYHQYIGKYTELFGAFIDSTNTHNYLITALVGRAIIENTACLRYYNNKSSESIKKIAEREKAGENPFLPEMMTELVEIVHQHMKGSRFDWSGFFTKNTRDFVDELIKRESNKKDAPPVDYPESLRIGKIMKPWEEEMPSLRFLYSFFCDLVHPNLGSNLLMIGVSNGEISVGGGSNKAVGKKLAIECVRFIAPIAKETSMQLAQSVLLSTLGKNVNH